MWFWYALAFALLSSLGTIVAKKVMKSVDHYTFLLINSIFTAPFLLFFSLYFYNIPKIDLVFWLVTLSGTSISVLAAILAFKAIRDAEVSLVSPLSAFNPIFTTIISFFTLGEQLSINDFLGIVLIVLGAYTLQFSNIKKGFFMPFKILYTNKAVRLTLAANFLWALTPTLEKTAIFHTVPNNPSFAAFVGQMVAIFIYILLVKKLSTNTLQAFKLHYRWFMLAGLLGGLGITSAFIAYSLSPLGISTAVFKIGILFNVIFSWIFFKEKNIKDKFLGAIIMILGITFIVI